MPDTDLEDHGLHTYLSALADEVDAGVPDRPVAAGAGVASRRRWLMPAGIAAGMALLTLGLLTQLQDDPASVDTVGEPAPTTAPPAETAQPSRASLEVVPSAGLADGDIVELRLQRPDLIDGTDLAVCTGDAVEAGLFASCDLSAVIGADGTQYAELRAEHGLRVSVSRVLQITRGSDDPNVPEPYDCALEPAGCILVVGDVLDPSIDVSSRVEFRSEPLPTPSLSLATPGDLSDNQLVTVEGRGFRPRGPLSLSICTTADVDTRNCEWDAEIAPFVPDEDGSFTTEVRARSAIYGTGGRTDCTAVDCVVAATDPSSGIESEPLRFSSGVVAPAPELTVTPAGPYADRQVVTVRGTGFPPNRDLAGDIGQCPANLDTAVEERCGYNASLLGEVLVGEDGTFEVEVELFANLIAAGTCVGPPGCVLAWVIPHGPIATSAPLAFSG